MRTSRPNKRVGLGKKSKNANRVDSFIWHLRVIVISKFAFYTITSVSF